ncbi:glycosyl hydrolase family 18 protein [Alkaliphilus transvaalensis]|uniref:glycosyl hydrolase family 18 protein n=1 Tax=Alkaliphilus transvaalensis TaxID=114628 RepID=UPI00047EA65D|nr:glycosyl hydrolase family 18 protein [Alkaliphilus transvaalensis]
MRKKVSILLILLMMVANTSIVGAIGQMVSLSDIDNHWIKDYKQDLYLLQHLGIFQGYTDGTFKPANPITREEFTKILIAALGEEIEVYVGSNSFQDVKPSNWSYHYVEKAVEKGILLPEEYQFILKPNTPITRQEMATMIIRALNIPLEALETGAIKQGVFIDEEDIPENFKIFIHLASEKGIINGYQTATGMAFRPNQTATRAEAALMLVRFLDQKTELKKTGFYAIDSFKQLEVTKHFDEVVFGWSALDQNDTGEISFTLHSKDSLHRLPSAYQEALQFVEGNQVDRKLMLTDTRTQLIYSLLDDQDNQKKLIESIIISLLEYEFSGIVMDLENIRNGDGGYRDAYTDFLRNLKIALRPYNLSLAVAVQPRNVIGYYDGYDFKGIGEIADEIILMAHDYHDSRTTSSLTDQAPFNKVHEALKDLLDEGVEANKIILGLQMAGGTQIRRTEDGNRTFYTPAFSAIYRSISERQGIYEFDYRTMTPQFYYLDVENRHENWIRFENKASIEAKLRLGKFYGIKGVSVWRIGEIPAEIIEILQ